MVYINYYTQFHMNSLSKLSAISERHIAHIVSMCEDHPAAEEHLDNDHNNISYLMVCSGYRHGPCTYHENLA